MTPTRSIPPLPKLRGKKPRVAVVVKRSAYQHYVREKKDERLITLIEEGDPTAKRLLAAHKQHEATVEEVLAALKKLKASFDTTVGARRHFESSGFDLVITVGGDGTLLRASHSVGTTPILAVNSAPDHSVGFFCGAKSGQVLSVLDEYMQGSIRRAELTRMQVKRGDEVVAGRVLNDALFCHSSPAATSRYLLGISDTVEEHKSSGFWIGPAAGSTAAQRSAGGRVLSLGSKRLQLVVREAYTPKGETYRFAHALIGPGKAVDVRSKMRDAKLYIDGPNNVVDVDYGDRLEFSRSEESLILLGISPRRKWGA